MAAMKALVAAATIMLMIQLAMATNFTVGSPAGSWDLTTNFATWTKANTFVVGDNLIFSYPPTQHDVVEVTKANYASCSTGSPIKTYTTGNDVIPLPTATTRYFICGFPGHCAAGMKVTINVGAAATPPTSSSTPAPTPSTSSPPPSHSTPTTSPTGSPPPSGSTPAPTTPTATPPPSGSTAAPTSPSAPSPTTPSTPSGANSHNLQAKAAVGFGLGMLMFLAL